MSQAPPLQIETITKPVTSAISTKRFLVTATQACFGECWRTGSLKYTPVLMMMSFICFCRNNNQPNAIYPLGTFHWGLKKLKKAAKAHVMMLPSCPLWYYDDPFSPLVDVDCFDAQLNKCRTHKTRKHTQCRRTRPHRRRFSPSFFHTISLLDLPRGGNMRWRCWRSMRVDMPVALVMDPLLST